MLRLAEYISRNYSGKVVEVGIGQHVDVAKKLAESGLTVVATDVVKREVPEGIAFYIDDIVNPNFEIYMNSRLVYSIRPPPEIVGSILRLSKAIGADCIIKPLYGEHFDGKLINYKGLSFYLFRGDDV